MAALAQPANYGYLFCFSQVLPDTGSSFNRKQACSRWVAISRHSVDKDVNQNRTFTSLNGLDIREAGCVRDSDSRMCFGRMGTRHTALCQAFQKKIKRYWG